jgi:hypothetical protein
MSRPQQWAEMDSREGQAPTAVKENREKIEGAPN